MLEYGFTFDLPVEEDKPIIKVVGVGGGGGNAVNHMFKMGVKDVDFIVCNTDRQALMNSDVPRKLQLGAHLTKGLGAGTNPEVGRQAALENTEDIRQLLGEPTQMVFITAGMGGGTGTGAAPVIAQIAREMGLLTIAVVTAPFDFEGEEKLEQAMLGINELKEYCDTVLVILNDKLAEIFLDFPMDQAFAMADDVLANAVKSIAEIITVRGDINVDFMDVKRVLEQAGQAVMGSADADGSERALRAIEEALNSPLLNDRDIRGAKRILLTMASGPEARATMSELRTITRYIQDKIGKQAHLFKYGTIMDESLGKNLRVTVIAAGFDLPPQDFPTYREPEPELIPEAVPELMIDEEVTAQLDEELRKEDVSLTPTSIGTMPQAMVDMGRRATTPMPVDVLIEEEREDDLLQIKQMIENFTLNRFQEKDLESPAFLRQRLMLHELPMIPDHELIRSRLND